MTNPSNSNPSTPNIQSFRERRSEEAPVPPGVERRQFSNSHDDLSPKAQELAKAVDEYKLRHRRRFITYEEILSVLHTLGYSKNEG